jgi:hypothetical protein
LSSSVLLVEMGLRRIGVWCTIVVTVLRGIFFVALGLERRPAVPHGQSIGGLKLVTMS